MKLHYFFGCILAAASLAVWPEIGLAHGGGGGEGGGGEGSHFSGAGARFAGTLPMNRMRSSASLAFHREPKSRTRYLIWSSSTHQAGNWR